MPKFVTLDNLPETCPSCGQKDCFDLMALRAMLTALGGAVLMAEPGDLDAQENN